MRTEVEARAGLTAQRGRKTAEEVLRLEDGDLLTAFGECETRGEAADAAADDYGVTQRETSGEIREDFRG